MCWSMLRPFVPVLFSFGLVRVEAASVLADSRIRYMSIMHES